MRATRIHSGKGETRNSRFIEIFFSRFLVFKNSPFYLWTEDHTALILDAVLLFPSIHRFKQQLI